MAKERSIQKMVLFPLVFISQVREELKFVTWPTREATVQSTAIVIGLSIIVGAYIGGLDFIFTKGVGLFLK